MTTATQMIPRGAPVRFSLARWKTFDPDEGARCYLQLSAAYP